MVEKAKHQKDTSPRTQKKPKRFHKTTETVLDPAIEHCAQKLLPGSSEDRARWQHPLDLETGGSFSGSA